MTLYLVYGDNGDYYAGRELVGVGTTEDEANTLRRYAESAPCTYLPTRKRWHDIEVEEVESGKVIA